MRTRNFQAVILCSYSDYESFGTILILRKPKTLTDSKRRKCLFQINTLMALQTHREYPGLTQSIHWFPVSEGYLRCRIILDLLCFFSWTSPTDHQREDDTRVAILSQTTWQFFWHQTHCYGLVELQRQNTSLIIIVMSALIWGSCYLLCRIILIWVSV